LPPGKLKNPKQAFTEVNAFLKSLVDSAHTDHIKTRFKEEMSHAKNFPDELQLEVNRFVATASNYIVNKLNPNNANHSSQSAPSSPSSSGSFKTSPSTSSSSTANNDFYLVSSSHIIIPEDTLDEMIKLPQEVTLNTWLATHCIEFFNAVLFAYSSIHDHCTELTCSEIRVGNAVPYTWEGSKVTARQYFEYLTHYIHQLVQNPAIFAPDGKPFPPSFKLTVKEIFKRTLPVYAHVFKCHTQQIAQKGYLTRFNNMVKHFYLFAKRFHLLESADFTPFLDLINTYKPKFRLDYSSLSDNDSDNENSSPTSSPSPSPTPNANQNNGKTPKEGTANGNQTNGTTPKEGTKQYVHIPRVSLDFIEICPVDEVTVNGRPQNPPAAPPPSPNVERVSEVTPRPKPPELPPKDPTLYAQKPPQLPPKSPELTSTPLDALEKLLYELSLQKYIEIFKQEEIDYEALSMLNGKQMQEMGIPLGPRCKILKHFQKMHIQENKDTSMFLHDIQIHRKLGEGHFGEVYEGVWQGTTRVALKTLHEDQVEEFTREFGILSKMKHPNIVSTLGLYEDPATNQQYIVTELYVLGNLRDFLISEFTNLTLADLLHLAKGVAAGCAYLSEAKIVHRDLAARNVLVTKQEGCYDVRVSDFGLSRSVQNSYYLATSSKMKFPFKWTAIEAVKFGRYSEKSDVWSYGILLYEIFEFGMEPYVGLSNEETITRVSEGYRLPCPASCPKPIYEEVMLPCWNDDPNKRPSFKQIFERLSRIEGNMFGPEMFVKPSQLKCSTDEFNYKDDNDIVDTEPKRKVSDPPLSNSNHYKEPDEYQVPEAHHYKGEDPSSEISSVSSMMGSPMKVEKKSNEEKTQYKQPDVYNYDKELDDPDPLTKSSSEHYDMEKNL